MLALLHFAGQRLVLSPGLELTSFAFLDDTSLLCSVSNLPHQVDLVQKWCDFTDTTVNVSKSDLLVAQSPDAPNDPVHIQITGTFDGALGTHTLVSLTDAHSTRLLGFFLSTKLDWHHQLANLDVSVRYVSHLLIQNALPIPVAIRYLNVYLNPKIYTFASIIPIPDHISQKWDIALSKALKRLTLSRFSSSALCSPQAMSSATGWVLPSTIASAAFISTTFNRLMAGDVSARIERSTWDDNYFSKHLYGFQVVKDNKICVSKCLAPASTISRGNPQIVIPKCETVRLAVNIDFVDSHLHTLHLMCFVYPIIAR